MGDRDRTFVVRQYWYPFVTRHGKAKATKGPDQDAHGYCKEREETMKGPTFIGNQRIC